MSTTTRVRASGATSRMMPFDIHDNRVEDNKQEGIGIEISYGGKIYNNTVKRNGLDDNRAGYWPWGSGSVFMPVVGPG